MNVGIDIDGPLAENPWKSWHWPFSKKPIRNRPVRLLLAFPYYIFRRPRAEAVQWIKEQQAIGNKVLLISGIYGLVGYFVLAWLKMWRVPFDGLYLRKDWRVDQPEYKARMTREHVCRAFIDDRLDVIEAIEKLWRQKGFGVEISKNNLGYVVTITV